MPLRRTNPAVRLRFDQLSRHLNRGLAPVYLLAGEEHLQLMEAGDAIRARARQAGYTEREVFHVEPGFDWAGLQAACDSLSLFAERRLIELRMPGGKPGVQGAKALEAYARRPPDDTLLLILCGKLDKGAQASAWFKAVEAAGVVLQVWSPTPEQMPDWIEARMCARGLEPEDEAVRLLAERVEGNLLAAAQEIDKLVLLNGPGPVSAEAVLAAVADSARYTVFDLTDAALAGDSARAVRVLETLRAEGVESLLVLWALTLDVRRLTALAEGGAPEQVLRGVPPKHRALVQRAVGRYPPQAWRRLLGQCARADRTIKSTSGGKPWDELLQLTIALSAGPLFVEAPGPR